MTFLPHMQSSIEGGSGRVRNPAALLYFPISCTAALRAPLIVSQSAGTDISGAFDVVYPEPFSPPGRSCSLISVSSSFPSVTTMSQKSSVMQLPQFVPKALTSDIVSFENLRK